MSLDFMDDEPLEDPFADEDRTPIRERTYDCRTCSDSGFVLSGGYDGQEMRCHDCTGYWLTPTGYAALASAAPRRLARKRRLVPALAAKRIYRLSTPAR